MESINLAEQVAGLSEAWVPKIVGELNGQHVKIARFSGRYIWHAHEHEDEFFMVLDGRIEIEFRDRTIALQCGECCIVPRGVEHRPRADAPAGVLLFEPASTRNTGSVDHPYTIEPSELEGL